MKAAWILVLLLAFGIATGCSSGPPPVKPGTPAFFWSVAKQSYRSGDLLQTDATLLDLGQTDSPFAAPARVWQLVLSAGLTQGYMELADAYEAGSLANPANAQSFRREAASLRSIGATTALEFAQAVHNMRAADPNAKVLLAFTLPPGSLDQPEALAKLAGGMLPDAGRDALLQAMLQRGVHLAIADAVGSPDDPGEAQAAFQKAELRVPQETFLYGMAKLLYQEADLFGPNRLDRQERYILMCRAALEALQAIPQSKEAVQLAAEVQGTLSQFGGI